MIKDALQNNESLDRDIQITNILNVFLLNGEKFYVGTNMSGELLFTSDVSKVDKEKLTLQEGQVTTSLRELNPSISAFDANPKILTSSSISKLGDRADWVVIEAQNIPGSTTGKTGENFTIVDQIDQEVELFLRQTYIPSLIVGKDPSYTLNLETANRPTALIVFPSENVKSSGQDFVLQLGNFFDILSSKFLTKNYQHLEKIQIIQLVILILLKLWNLSFQKQFQKHTKDVIFQKNCTHIFY